MTPSQPATGGTREMQHGLARPTFFLLPAELRLKIYQQVYTDVVVGIPASGQHLRATWGVSRYREQNQLSTVSSLKPDCLAPDYELWHTPFALLHVCRTTRRESEPAFYQTVLFHLRDPCRSYWAISSSLLLGRPAAKSINNVMICDKEALDFYRALAEGKLFLPNLKSVLLQKDDWTTSEDQDSRPCSKYSDGFRGSPTES